MTVRILARAGRPDVVPAPHAVLEAPNERRLRSQVYPFLARKHTLRRLFSLGQRGANYVRRPPARRLPARLWLKPLYELLDLLARPLAKHVHREALRFRVPDRRRPSAVVRFGGQEHIRLIRLVHHLYRRAHAIHRDLEIRPGHAEHVHRGRPGRFLI